MADIRCPNCGKNNPDVLDVCQFCQTRLKPDSVLGIGQQPTKKDTGELEPMLPDWLRDVRQQARDSAEEEAAHAASMPKLQKDEPPDLLAGLASQASAADEEEVPDWLASIRPAVQQKPQADSTPTPEKDFSPQSEKNEPEPGSEATQEETPSWLGAVADESSAAEEKDELSKWFAQAAEGPEEQVELEPHAGQDDRGWLSSFDTTPSPAKETPPKEEEDLSWLRNLEETAKQTGDLKGPKSGTDWTADFEAPSAPAQPSSSQEDLSWLDSLGGIEEAPQQPLEQGGTRQEDLSWLNQFGAAEASKDLGAEKEEPSAPKEDLNWLNNLGAAPDPAQPFDAAPDKPISPPPFDAEEDLSWLNNLAGTPEPSQPFSTPLPDDPDQPPRQEDLSWLNNLGGDSQPAQSVEGAQEDLSWLEDLDREAEPLSTPPLADTGSLKGTGPRQTAPLGKSEDQQEPEPDWLKSATESPSMPAPGDVSMDWFTQHEEAANENDASPAEPTSSTSEPPAFADIFSAPSKPDSLSNQDVDSLFSVEMPDWLSHAGPAGEEQAPSQTGTADTPSDDSLTPVELPSWVQAMRPVEAAISEPAADVEVEPEEKEGPLAGLRGVIPGAPVGSAMRPKAISLKLQATEDQQASAALLEQILGSETSPRALVSSSFIASQHALRWTVAALLLLILGAAISLRSQSMPVSASLSPEGSSLSSAVLGIPAGSNVLVVIDYEPALAGEMEAIARPLLDQMVLLGRPNLSFVATSPNGSALVERLLNSAAINTSDGFGYQPGVQYRNLGFLPGGSAGVLGFVEGPGEIIPAAQVASFAEYAAVVVMTDHAESGRVWVEQLQNLKQIDPSLSNQPLLVVASAQAGPLLQPYVASQQISGMISGLSDAARYEARNNRPGTARLYWDAFGIGLATAVTLIVAGSLWSLVTGIRARRAEAEQG